MHPALRETAHRPWPLPSRRWLWRQSWLDIAFIHYRVDASVLRAKIPEGLKVQEFDGSAWVGLVPFRMHGVMRRPIPPLFGLMSFPELNLRTYVDAEGKPGVWFFSLDADNLAVVAGGRGLYGLPYFRAKMSHRNREGWIEFESARRSEAVRFASRYRGVGKSSPAEAETFEHWVAERYCMYSGNAARGLRRAEVHHIPWPLQKAEVQLVRNDILVASGIETLEPNPICHFSSGVDVVSYPITRVEGRGR